MFADVAGVDEAKEELQRIQAHTVAILARLVLKKEIFESYIFTHPTCAFPGPVDVISTCSTSPSLSMKTLLMIVSPILELWVQCNSLI